MSVYSLFLNINVLAHVRLLDVGYYLLKEKNESLLISLAPQIQGVLNNLALEVENSSC